MVQIGWLGIRGDSFLRLFVIEIQVRDILWQRGNPRNIRPHLVNRYLIWWFNDLLEAYRIKSEIDLVTKGIVTNRWY